MGGSYSTTTVKEFGFDVHKLYRGDLEAARESRQADWENFVRMVAQQRKHVAVLLTTQIEGANLYA
jgi:hypothetical protein